MSKVRHIGLFIYTLIDAFAVLREAALNIYSINSGAEGSYSDEDFDPNHLNP